jgi:hypothetical protein
MELVQQMIDNAPIDPNTNQKVNPFASYGTPKKGDLLYKDTNGDGVINDNDRVPVGHGTAPRMTYGFNMGFDYKGFDFSVFLQGNAGNKVVWTDGYYTPTVRWGYQINQEIADGRWTEGATDAKFPRLLPYTDTRNTKNSDFWLQNKAFIRVKISSWAIQFRTISLSGYRCKTYAYLHRWKIFGPLLNIKVSDPEISGTNYPTMKQAVFGVSLSF